MFDSRFGGCTGVRCRVGSSENELMQAFNLLRVRCRVGSSENLGMLAWGEETVRCRVGSSESNELAKG